MPIKGRICAINAGYTAITFAEFKAGADLFVQKGTKLALPVGGFVFDAAGNGYLYPVTVAGDGESFDIDRNEVKKIPIGLKNSLPEIAAKFIDQCSSVDFCSMILVGHATQCAWTNVFNNTANIPCFAVETVYGTAEMVDEAVEANRAAAASRPTIPSVAPAPQTTNIIVAPSAPPPPQQSSVRVVNPRTVSAPAPTLPVSTGGGSSSFEKGHNDRVIWETWFQGLVGEQHDGALCWASTRSTNARGSCHGDLEFMTGVNSAKAFLDPVDANRLTDPAYRLGFNTYP
jgi:hypothetical protein